MSARLLALANVLDGMSREEAARAAGMDRPTLRDWGLRFNAAGVAGLRDRPRPGRPPWLTEGEQAALKAIVLRGPDPDPDRYGVSAWRILDLCRIAEAHFGVVSREGGLRRLVKPLGLSWPKTRPSHPKADRAAQERFKKGVSRMRWARSRGATPAPRSNSGARCYEGGHRPG